MSCFQSRTQDAALDALVPHITSGQVDGIQLTPGNLTSPNFRSRVEALQHDGAVVRFHQGFSWTHYRRRVLDGRLSPLGIEPDWSIHAPRLAPRHPQDEGPFATWARWMPVVLEHELIVETMYPGYALGCGDDLDSAMDEGVRLAVDIAHLSIQQNAGVLSNRTLGRLLDYPQVNEVHISHSLKGKDTHSPVRPDTPMLEWAKSKIDEVPVVLESYWHKSPFDEQVAQLDLVQS